MTDKQIILEKYIRKHFSNQQIQQTQILPTNTHFITKWIKKISEKNALNFIKDIYEPHTNQPSMFYSIPEIIRKKEIPKLNQHVKINFISYDRPISIFISHTQNTTPSNQFIQRCIQVIHTLSEFAPKYCIQSPLNIYIYLTHAQKTINHHEEFTPISEQHANTAFTTSCETTTKKTPKEIILFRQEEVFKVLIHELFHALGMDFSNNHSQTIQSAQLIRHFLSVKMNDIRLFETYTETWACILNTICLLVWENPHKTHEILTKKIQKRFQNEQKFSLWQASKIIHYNQIYYQNFIKKCLKPTSCFLSPKRTQRQTHHHNNTKTKSINKTQKQPNKREYKENTQVFCYFLLKAAVFQKIDIFVTQFPPPFNQHQNNTEENHAQDFAQFLLEAFQDTDFANKLQKMSAIYVKYFDTHPRKEQWMFDTMRQTVNEIDILS